MSKLTIIAIALAVVGGAFLLSQSLSNVRAAAGYERRDREIQQRMDSYTLRRLALDEQIKAVEKRVEDLGALIAAMRKDVAGKEGELARLREENERLQARLDELRSQPPPAPPAPPPPPPAPPAPVQPPTAPPGSGKVTLTFDDSSSASRAYAILDVLSRYGVTAVFCMEGNWARQNPDVMERIQREGHKLCNHTASHAMLTRLSDQGVRDEILGGIPSDILRPPYGAYDARVESIAASLGYRIYMWSIDTRDWTGVSAGTIVNTVMTGLRPGAVVLMHLQGPSTLDALPPVIEGVRATGYELGL